MRGQGDGSGGVVGRRIRTTQQTHVASGMRAGSQLGRVQHLLMLLGLRCLRNHLHALLGLLLLRLLLLLLLLLVGSGGEGGSPPDDLRLSRLLLHHYMMLRWPRWLHRHRLLRLLLLLLLLLLCGLLLLLEHLLVGGTPARLHRASWRHPSPREGALRSSKPDASAGLACRGLGR